MSAQTDTSDLQIDIGNNENFSGFESLSGPLKNKRMVFSGAVNSYASFNSKFEFKLLKYLHQKHGFHNYLLEIGPAKALLVNQYVNSEDSTVEKLLQSVTTLKYMRLYRNLKKYNKTLPDSQKIKVYGVDVERYSSLPLVRVSQLLPEDSIPDDLRIAVEALEGAAKYIISKGLESYEREKEGKSEYSYYYNPTSFSVRESLDEFLHFYDSLHARFQSWLGPRFPEVEEAVGWMKENKNWDKYYYSAFQFPVRENYMFQRINDILKKYPGEKFFGQFELCRVSREVLPKGCDFYDFSGIVNRLLKNEESACREVLNIGVFYRKDVRMKILAGTSVTSLYQQDAVHAMFNDRLDGFFDSARELSAAFYIPQNTGIRDSAIRMNYDVLLLNNNYPVAGLASDTTSEDSVTWDVGSKGSWLDDYDKSRIYVGVEYHDPFINMGKINAVLVNNGLDGIGNISSTGAAVSIASADRSLVRFFYGQGNAGVNYNNYRFHMDFGYNYIYTKHVKMSVMPGLGYVRHKLSLNDATNNQAFFSNYKPPKILVNPALLFSASAGVFLEYAPFYIYAQGGRMMDLGNTRWKYKGEYTGTNGSLSNTAWYLSFGFGVALKMDWLGI